MNFIYEKIGKFLGEIKSRIYGETVTLSSFEYCECGYKNSNQPPRGQRWLPAGENFSLGNKSGEMHAWIRTKITIPESMLGKSVALVNNSFETDGNVKPQYLVYIDGKMAGAFDRGRDSIDIDTSVPEHDLLIYLYIQ